jgi:hypothetical protein
LIAHPEEVMRCALLVGLLAVPAVAAAAGGGGVHKQGAFQDVFPVDPKSLSPTGRNAYFILEPGYTLSLAGTEDGKSAALVIRVLPETKRIAGVETRVVEERETVGGQLVEVSRNYYAIARGTNDVYYFGEQVDSYARGKVTGHAGSWLAGKGGCRYGLMMPGTPRVGQRYCEEIAPGIALDRATVVGRSGRLATPAGRFAKVLEIRETNPLELGVTEHKFYAPGIGLVRDGDLELERYGTWATPPAPVPG